MDQAEPPTLGEIVKEWWFPTAVWYADLKDADRLNAELLSAIASIRSETAKGIVRSNSLGWHSEVDMHRRVEFSRLLGAVIAIANHCCADLKIDPLFEPFVDNCWANVSPRYAYNRSHTHPGVWLSGVYYVQTPANCGKLIFTDPRPQAQVVSIPTVTPGPDTWHNVSYDPIAGRVVLFPAWLAHEVEPNLHESVERVSIAFNLGLRRRPSNETTIA